VHGGWKGCTVAGALLLAAAMPFTPAAQGQVAGAVGGNGPAGVGALGRVEPQSGLIELGAPPGGRLLSLTVKLGEAVKKDQVLGYLDSYPVQVAARDQAAAQLAEARARQQAETVLGDARVEQAGKKADAESRVARAAAAEALAAIPVASLQKALAVEEARVDAATLKSPIDGTVLDIPIQPGETIGNGPALVLGDLRRMRVRAEVYETDIPRVKLGQTTTIRSPALDKPLTGRIVEIGLMVFKNSVLSGDPAARVDARIVPVRIELDDGSAVANLSNLTVDVVIAAPPANPGPAAQAADK